MHLLVLCINFADTNPYIHLMKKLVLMLLTGLVLIGLSSCRSEEPPPTSPEKPENASSEHSPFRVSLQEALDYANSTIPLLTHSGTRSKMVPSKVDYITASQGHTRGENVCDTLLYLVNFGNGAGYAVLGADKRVDPLYAFSDEGALSMNDTVNNKGLALFLENIKVSALARISSYTPTRGFGIDEPIKPGFGERKITMFLDVPPMLNKNVRKWTQKANFNKYIYAPGVLNPLVGCAPLACAQIMSYYEWPQKYMGANLNWTQIKAFDVSMDWDDTFDIPYFPCHDELAFFLAKVASTLEVEYTADGTVSQYDKLRNNFYKFGYESLPAHTMFSATSVKRDIQISPLLVSASCRGKRDGHTWVIDGFLDFKEEWDAIDNPTHTLYHTYYHCVWGWEGSNNGYFKWENDGMYNTYPDYGFADDDPGYNSDIDNINLYNLYYWSNFKPLR